MFMRKIDDNMMSSIMFGFIEKHTPYNHRQSTGTLWEVRVFSRDTLA